jgi:hypothetical protein
MDYTVLYPRRQNSTVTDVRPRLSTHNLRTALQSCQLCPDIQLINMEPRHAWHWRRFPQTSGNTPDAHISWISLKALQKGSLINGFKAHQTTETKTWLDRNVPLPPHLIPWYNWHYVISGTSFVKGLPGEGEVTFTLGIDPLYPVEEQMKGKTK